MTQQTDALSGSNSTSTSTTSLPLLIFSSLLPCSPPGPSHAANSPSLPGARPCPPLPSSTRAGRLASLVAAIVRRTLCPTAPAPAQLDSVSDHRPFLRRCRTARGSKAPLRSLTVAELRSMLLCLDASGTQDLPALCVLAEAGSISGPAHHVPSQKKFVSSPGTLSDAPISRRRGRPLFPEPLSKTLAVSVASCAFSSYDSLSYKHSLLLTSGCSLLYSL